MAAKDWAHDDGVDLQSWQSALSQTEPWNIPLNREAKPLIEGDAEGILYGGCLSILVASSVLHIKSARQGRFFSLKMFGAKPYQIDRMLMQLKIGGHLDHVRGVIFGEMLDCIQTAEIAATPILTSGTISFFKGPMISRWFPVGACSPPYRAIGRLPRVGALRSGFPYTVYTLAGGRYVRANITDPALTRASGELAPGGEYLLNPAGFGAPGGPGLPSGRNAFTGPGLYNFDLAVSRSFLIHGLPESSRLVFRADFYNVLNHANLNNPNPVFVSGAGFGLATFGRTGRPTGFPTSVPLAETPRQIQLSLRLRF